MTMRIVVALACLVLGCGAEAPTLRSDLAFLATSMPAWTDAVPDSREAFLEVLAPLPADTIRVRYAVSGPAGLSGTLQVVLRPGGRRHEGWDLTLPLPDAEPRRIAGTATQTADYIWTGSAGERAVERAPLGALADAYLAMPDDGRRAVIDSLRAFRSRLVTAREHLPGAPDSVLGVPCLGTRLAAQDLCVWEQTGLPLRYRGNAFSLTATDIELRAEIPADTFEVPTEVERDAPGPDLDPAASLLRLARRDYAELGPLLHPGLRLPLG